MSQRQTFLQIPNQYLQSHLQQQTLDLVKSKLHNEKFLGGYQSDHVAALFLYHLMTGKSYHTIEVESRFPHSNFKSWFGQSRKIMIEWAESMFKRSTKDQRLAVKNGMNLPACLGAMDTIVDGIHFGVEDSNRNYGEVGYSHKLHRNGRGYQVCVDLSGNVIWCSSGFPASKHDSQQWKESYVDFMIDCSFDPLQESIGGDGGYIGRTAEMVKKVPHKKPKNGTLTQAQTEFNNTLSHYRVAVEHMFGHARQQFLLLNKTFRGHYLRFDEYVKIIFALYQYDKEKREENARNLNAAPINLNAAPINLNAAPNS